MWAKALALVVFLLIAVGAWRAMKPSLDTMKARGGKDIVALEFARTPDDVATLRRGWASEGDAAARRSIWVDFVFVVGYVGFPAFLCWWLAVVADGREWQGWARVAALAMVAFVVAGLCDLAENVGMLNELRGPPDAISGHWPVFTSAFAYAKFGLLALATPTVLTVLIAIVAARKSG